MRASATRKSKQQPLSVVRSRSIASYFQPNLNLKLNLSDTSCIIVDDSDVDKCQKNFLLTSDAIVRRQAFLAESNQTPKPANTIAAALRTGWPFPPAWCLHVGWLASPSNFVSFDLEDTEPVSVKAVEFECNCDDLYNYATVENSANCVDAAASSVQLSLSRLPSDDADIVNAELASLRADQPGFPASRYLNELRSNVADYHLISTRSTDTNSRRRSPVRSLADLLAPRSASGVLGNAEAVRNLADWLAASALSSSGASPAPSRPCVALIEGPGRSCVAHAIARQLDLRVLEIGAEERRHGPKLAQRLHQLATCCQVERKRRRCDGDVGIEEAVGEAVDLLEVADLSVSSAWLILLDDADQPLDDEPSLLRLVSGLCASSRKPLLLAAADAEALRRGLGLTEQEVPIFRLRRPTQPLVAAFARVVCLSLGYRLSAAAAASLVSACQGDIGRLLNLMHWVLLSPGSAAETNDAYPSSSSVHCRLSIASAPAPIDSALLLEANNLYAVCIGNCLTMVSLTVDVVAFADRLRRRRRRCAEAADRLASAGLSLLARLSLLSNQGGRISSASFLGDSRLTGLPNNGKGLARLLRDLRQPQQRPFGCDESLDRATFMRGLANSTGLNKRSLSRLANRRLQLSLTDSALHYLLRCNTLLLVA